MRGLKQVPSESQCGWMNRPRRWNFISCPDPERMTSPRMQEKVKQEKNGQSQHLLPAFTEERGHSGPMDGPLWPLSLWRMRLTTSRVSEEERCCASGIRWDSDHLIFLQGIIDAVAQDIVCDIGGDPQDFLGGIAHGDS